MSRFARAYEPLPVSGTIRQRPEDFAVAEILNMRCAGAGGHVWLQVQKRGITTPDAARLIAAHAGISCRDVGYSGLKDRHALATQWFSLPITGPEPDWDGLNSDLVRICQRRRHHRKLRRGTHRGNRFRIVIRDLQGPLEALWTRLTRIRERGVPNYFGPQRFGRHGNNLQRAEALLTSRSGEHRRFQRGLYLSAARSWIFNEVLSVRVASNSWDCLRPGDVAMLDGSHSVFPVAEVDDKLCERVADGDLHPTGPLAGRGANPSQLGVRSIEDAVERRYAGWCAGLAQTGVRQQRRALRMRLAGLSWDNAGRGDWTLNFTLCRGGFATSVLRECGRFVTPISQ